MKKVLSFILCFLCILTLFTGCSSGEPVQVDSTSHPVSASSETDKPETEVVEIVSPYERAKSVFVKIDDSKINTLYSPVSLEMALGLLSEGASGETRQQFVDFLGSNDYAFTAKSIVDYANSLSEGASTDDEDDWKTEMHFANSIWLNKDGYKLSQYYQNAASMYYKAMTETLDFSDAEKTCQTINNWCDENTRGLIKEVLTPDKITPVLEMILCNSTYFKSGWKDAWMTRVDRFTNADGTVVELEDMLYGTVDTYYEADNAVAFSKPYRSGSQFIGILPSEGTKFEDIDIDALLTSKTDEYDVKCSMPKLNYDYSIEGLANILQELGVVAAFDPSVSDFGVMLDESSRGARLCVSDVIQKCKIELDENGTKAAAVTTIMMDNAMAIQETPPEIKTVYLNRPFYYMIIDENINQVLFIK